MMNQVLVWVAFLAICAITILGIWLVKPSEDGFTDVIPEGEAIYQGYTDKARPDIYVRPRMRGGFWGHKYTPIWLKRRKEEEKDSEKETEDMDSRRE